MGDRPFLIVTFDGESVRHWQFEVDCYSRKVLARSTELDELAHHLSGKTMVLHNATFDLRALSALGLILSFGFPLSDFPPGRIIPSFPERRICCEDLHDTLLLSHIVFSQGAGGSSPHGLKNLAFHYLDWTDADQLALSSSLVSARRIAKSLGWQVSGNFGDCWILAALSHHLEGEVPDAWKDLVLSYCIKDAKRTLGLYYFLSTICEEHGLESHYDLERRLLPVTYLIENSGVSLSRKRLHHLLHHYKKLSRDYKESAEKITGVNIDSPKQVASWLSMRQVSSPSLTPSGNQSVDARSLRTIARTQSGEVESALRLIAGFRKMEGDGEDSLGYRDCISAVKYLENYQRLMVGGRVYPSFHQVGTKFTRFSCSSPNLQNVAKSSLIPLREVFGPQEGYLWLDFDYSQIELRIFAVASGDEDMQKAFQQGHDFHTFTASRLYQVPSDRVSPEERRRAKAINFKAIYGGLNNVPKEYSSQFPKAAEFMRAVQESVRRRGYVTTFSGRRLYIDPQKAYVGVDAIVQGTAGEVVKLAMVRLHELGLVDWTGSKIIANIHDELILEIPCDYPVIPLARRIKAVMESAGDSLGVTTPVDVHLVRTKWSESEEIDLCPKRKAPSAPLNLPQEMSVGLR